VEPDDFGAKEKALLAEAAALRAEVAEVLKHHPDADPDNVRHTLILLKMDPWERLARALIRGRCSKRAAMVSPVPDRAS